MISPNRIPVEKNVRDARHRLWQPVPEASTLPLSTTGWSSACKALWGEIRHGMLPGILLDAWKQELPLMMRHAS